MSKSRMCVVTLLAGLLLAGPALAQSPAFGFSYRAEGNPSPSNVQPNGVIAFTQGAVGVPQSAVLLIQNRNETTWNLTRMIVSGAGFTGVANVPLSIAPAQTLPVNLGFSPTRRGTFEGTVSVDLESGSQRTSFLFFLRATVPTSDLVLSYIVNPSGNQLPLTGDASIRFPSTPVGQSSSVTVIITNRGNGAGTLSSVSVSGDVFRVSGLPLLPFSIAPDREARFNISFSPTSRQRATANLSLSLDGETRAIALEADAVGPSLTYQAVTDGEVVSVAPDQSIRFQDVAVNSNRTTRIFVRNEGDADARIAAIAVTGTGFQLAELPVLPVTLTPGASTDFAVVFTPRESGPASGRLRIDAVSFPLSGVGLGAKIEYTINTGTGAAPLTPNGVILFPNTALGSTAQGELRLTNSGNMAATISAISITGTAFELRDLPGLPFVLEPEQSLTVGLRLKPDAVGTLNGVLQIDETRFTLRAIGSSPPPLPGIQLQGPAQSVEPLQQPAVSLTLQQPYALDLTGKLTLTFTPSSFQDDPAVQFATGGRTVEFRIPAGTTNAVFADGPRQIVFQTGTVAGQIGIAASFSTSSVDVTPQPAPSLSMSVAPGPPQLRNVQIVPRNASSVDIIVNGFSTARSVSEITLRFTPAPGVGMQSPTLNANVEAAFDSWYQNTASRAFGSQFSAVLTINITGDASALQSVSVTAASARGSSNTVTASFR